MPLTTLVVQSATGTTALNGTAPDPTNVPGLNWYASTASIARRSAGGITNGNAALNTLSYQLPIGLHKVSVGASNALASTGYVILFANASGNTFPPSTSYNLSIRGGGVQQAEIGRNGISVGTFGPIISGAIDSAYLDCSVSGTVSASVTISGTTYTGSYTDASPVTGSYAGLYFGEQSGGTVTLNSLTLEGNTVTYTYSRPSSDVTTQWTPSTGTDHFALIDETTANDADYISATAAGQTDEVKLAAMTAPQAGTDLLINYKVTGIVGSATVTLSLVCNTTVHATDTTRTANGDYTLTVPSGTWASVADWTNMRLRFVSA